MGMRTSPAAMDISLDDQDMPDASIVPQADDSQYLNWITNQGSALVSANSNY